MGQRKLLNFNWLKSSINVKTQCQSCIHIKRIKMGWNFVSAIMNVASLVFFWPFIRRKNFCIVWISVVLFTSDIHQINGEPNQTCKYTNFNVKLQNWFCFSMDGWEQPAYNPTFQQVSYHIIFTLCKTFVYRLKAH